MTDKIRILTICLFSNSGRVLAAYGRDDVKNETFFRPFGGGVEFGESSEQALRREIMEELGEDIADLRLLDVVENIYQFNGRPGHEVVFVYDAKFVRDEPYALGIVQGIEEDRALTLQGHWIRVEDALNGAAKVYPAAIVDVLRKLT